MPNSVNHHVGLRVTDIDRAARFYIEAFGARYKARPFTIEGDFAEVVMDGPPGVKFKVCMLDFDDGTIELFEFLDPVEPAQTVHPTRGNIIHMAVQVDDVQDALAMVEAAGGRRLWPDVNPWGTATVIFVLDPDGNILELIDHSMDQIAELTFENFPEARP